ncbi:hypothetical protein E2C01_051508 [Portunus trituberculatus]|uniref:Uncharacterized protein n=1 Tax=Portunus trituberculatus TaxID=210409 RepID=A0A5B7GJQ9_PORTR|nr:hypothetical protein [Portunus trituberculatus]
MLLFVATSRSVREREKGRERERCVVLLKATSLEGLCVARVSLYEAVMRVPRRTGRGAAAIKMLNENHTTKKHSPHTCRIQRRDEALVWCLLKDTKRQAKIKPQAI